jgi:UDP-N-acetylmuramoylalanine-D-glutamate ligase
VKRERPEHATPNHAKRKHLQKLKNKKKHSLENAFTACTAGISLLETVTDAADFAARLATSLLSTARSSFDEFQNARNCGEKLYILVKSISWGGSRMNPNRCGEMTAVRIRR